MEQERLNIELLNEHPPPLIYAMSSLSSGVEHLSHCVIPYGQSLFGRIINSFAVPTICVVGLAARASFERKSPFVRTDFVGSMGAPLFGKSNVAAPATQNRDAYYYFLDY